MIPFHVSFSRTMYVYIYGGDTLRLFATQKTAQNRMVAPVLDARSALLCWSIYMTRLGTSRRRSDLNNCFLRQAGRASGGGYECTYTIYARELSYIPAAVSPLVLLLLAAARLHTQINRRPQANRSTLEIEIEDTHLLGKNAHPRASLSAAGVCRTRATVEVHHVSAF